MFVVSVVVIAALVTKATKTTTKTTNCSIFYLLFGLWEGQQPFAESVWKKWKKIPNLKPSRILLLMGGPNSLNYLVYYFGGYYEYNYTEQRGVFRQIFTCRPLGPTGIQTTLFVC